MSIILTESWDRYSGVTTTPGLGAKWATFDGGTSYTPSLVAGRLGGLALRQSCSGGSLSSDGWVKRSFADNNEVCLHFAFRAATAPTTDNPGHILVLYYDTTYQVGFRLSSLGEIVVSRATAGNSGVELGRTDVAKIVENAWHFLKIYVKIGDSTGAVKIYIDNNLELDISGVDTKNHASVSLVNLIQLGHSTGADSNTIIMDWDDIYITNGPILAEATYTPCSPTSDVAQGFSRSTGSDNYALVDEMPVVTTDYVTSALVGTVDTYEFANLPSTPQSILAVVVSAVARKTDAGDRGLALQVKSGSTTSDGPTNYLSTTNLHYERVLETDPDTSAAWTASAVNALRGGPKVAA